MVTAARALVREVRPEVGEDPDEVAREFRAHLVEPKVFFDPFAGAKFAHYFLRALAAPGGGDDTPESKAWAKTALDYLWQTGAKPVLEWLDTTRPGSTEAGAIVQRERGYFSTNAARMQYASFRDRQLPIGSGAVALAICSRRRGALIDRVPRWGPTAACAKQAVLDKLVDHRRYIARHGIDMPEIRNWRWSGAPPRPS